MTQRIELPTGTRLTLAELGDLIAGCWSHETCDETDAAKWSKDRASIGQCTSTAYVLNDLLGGKLLGAEVTMPDGLPQGHHYWNLLDSGLEIDLTLDQFQNGEIVGPPMVLERIFDVPEPGAERYLELRRRVEAALQAKASS